MSEHFNTTRSFEQNTYTEVEQKFTTSHPEIIEPFRRTAHPIEQLYLSLPDEPYSVRLREEFVDNHARYSATLKTRGSLDTCGLTRREVTTSISPETYSYYNQPGTPRLRKLRAEPLPGITIDFFEDGHVQIENEQAQNWEAFVDSFTFHNHLIDITHLKDGSNEWRAYEISGQHPTLPDILTTEQIIDDIMHHQDSFLVTTVSVAGRSGSGKSTIVSTLRDQLRQRGVEPAVISTDDYNRGKLWLDTYSDQPWSNWDHPLVYDTKLFAQEVLTLRNGVPIPKRQFDFTTQEPTTLGFIQPSRILIIEGIYARSKHIAPLIDLPYTQKTPLATCIGQRLERDFFKNERANDSLGRPEDILRYMLEVAEPTYRTQTS